MPTCSRICTVFKFYNRHHITSWVLSICGDAICFTWIENCNWLLLLSYYWVSCQHLARNCYYGGKRESLSKFYVISNSLRYYKLVKSCVTRIHRTYRKLSSAEWKPRFCCRLFTINTVDRIGCDIIARGCLDEQR